jgi:hypothetical protein
VTTRPRRQHNLETPLVDGCRVLGEELGVDVQASRWEIRCGGSVIEDRGQGGHGVVVQNQLFPGPDGGKGEFREKRVASDVGESAGLGGCLARRKSVTLGGTDASFRVEQVHHGDCLMMSVSVDEPGVVPGERGGSR